MNYLKEEENHGGNLDILMNPYEIARSILYSLRWLHPVASNETLLYTQVQFYLRKKLQAAVVP